MSESFRYSEDSEQIDIALISYNTKSNVLKFGGARRKLIHITDNELNTYQGDKFPIGGLFLEKERCFSDITIHVKKGDMIYIGSDGFQDQFGGVNQKKLSSKKLHDILHSISDYELDLQLIHLRMFFKEWKGALPQIDDVCVMGIRF